METTNEHPAEHVPHPELPQQLRLIESDELAEVPERFRLDERTRRIGLAALARVKAQLAEQNARLAERDAVRKSRGHIAPSAAHRRAA
jgi:hypothetical protein